MRKLMSRLDGVNLFAKKLEMEDDEFVPTMMEVNNRAKLGLQPEGKEGEHMTLVCLHTYVFVLRQTSQELLSSSQVRRRRRWRAALKKRRCRRGAILNAKQTSLWMQKAGARGPSRENDHNLQQTKLTVFTFLYSMPKL